MPTKKVQENMSSAPHAPDLVIRNGTIIDGSGDEAYSADLAIGGGKITAIGQNLPKGG